MAITDLINRPFGGAPTWDDIRVPVTATVAGGSNPPTFARFRDNGLYGLGYAVSFDGVNDYLTIPHDDSAASPVYAFNSSWSVSFWAYLPAGLASSRYLFYHPQWYIRTNTSARLRANLTTKGSVDTVVNAYLPDQRNHIVVVVTETSNVNVVIYINGTEVASADFNNALQADSGDDILLGYNGSTPYTRFVVDDVRFFSSALTEDDVVDLYAGGYGTADIIEPDTMVSHYLFSEGTGTSAADSKFTGGTTHTAALTGATWTTGLVQSSGSHGVFSYHFDDTIEQELFFSVQIPHDWIEYAYISPHIHWCAEDNENGVVVWGLEYSWANVGEAFPPTTVVTATSAAAGQYVHNLVEFPNIEGETKQISSMLMCRVYRDASSTDDTYPGQAVLLEIDFHYQHFEGSAAQYHR